MEEAKELELAKELDKLLTSLKEKRVAQLIHKKYPNLRNINILWYPEGYLRNIYKRSVKPDIWWTLKDYKENLNNYIELQFNEGYSKNNQILHIGDEVVYDDRGCIFKGVVHHFTKDSLIINPDMKKYSRPARVIGRYYINKKVWKL